MTNLWKAEPTLILSAVSAGIALLLAFGVPVTKEQMGAIMAFVAAVLGLINRAQVTSPASLQNMTPKDLATAQDAAQPVKDISKKLPVVLLACVLGFGSVTWPACTPPPTIVTQPGKTAYTADQIVLRVNELEKAAIAANAGGGLDLNTTRTIVTFAVSADKILAATPDGWRASVEKLWAETKAKLPPQTNTAIVAAMSAVDVVLGAL